MKEVQSANAIIQDLKMENSHLHTKVQTAEKESISLREENVKLKKALDELKNPPTRSNPPTSCTVALDPILPSLLSTQASKTIEKPPGHRQSTSPKINNSSYNFVENTLILGDSHTRRLAEKIGNATAIVNPGRGVEKLDTSVVKNHRQVVPMAGSNNIGSGDSIQAINLKFQDVINEIKTINPDCKLFVNEIIPRYDINRSKKISMVNLNLRSTCKSLDINLIPAPDLTRADYTNHGLHLVRSGKIKLANSIAFHLNQSSDLSSDFLRP